MPNEFWRYFNLAGCSVQHMKLCTFNIGGFLIGCYRLDSPNCLVNVDHHQNFSVYGKQFQNPHIITNMDAIILSLIYYHIYTYL